MKTHLWLLGSLLSLTSACDSTDSTLSTATARDHGVTAAKTPKEATEAPATSVTPPPASKSGASKRAGRAPLPAHLFM